MDHRDGNLWEMAVDPATKIGGHRVADHFGGEVPVALKRRLDPERAEISLRIRGGRVDLLGGLVDWMAFVLGHRLDEQTSGGLDVLAAVGDIPPGYSAVLYLALSIGPAVDVHIERLRSAG